METKVCKFGGTSLATREQIEKSIDIMLSDSSRKYMVVSAPGAAYNGDKKITDLLIKSAGEYRYSRKSVSADSVIERFREILDGDAELVGRLWTNLQERLSNTRAKNYEDNIKAFGEYANGIVVNSILQARGIASEFFDPRELAFTLIGYGDNIKPDPRCYKKMGAILEAKTGGLQIAVIPGFYAYTRKGDLVTMGRDSSDTSGSVVTGAVATRSVIHPIYENWTDMDGLKRVNPNIIPDAETISEMMYGEARGLAYSGFKLLDKCFEPIEGRGIVLNVRNTNNPNHPGTRIVDEREIDPAEYIVGVACESDPIFIRGTKRYSDEEVGLGRKLFQIFEERKIPYEHHPNGVDSLGIILRGRYLEGDNKLAHIVCDIEKKCGIKNITTENISLLSVTGRGLKNHIDSHARIFPALARAGIHIKPQESGADDYSFFIGVDQPEGHDAVRAIYNEFYGKK